MFRFNFVQILYLLPGILIGLSVHEFSHAYIATKFGDPTPGNQGRLTLNPLKHLDPVGFIMIILLGFGWAKPVMINHSYFKNPKRDDSLIALSGPVSNILVGIFFIFLMRIANNYNLGDVFNIAFYSAYINFILAVFNILPIYPLDGFHLLSNAIGLKNFKILSYIQRYSVFILIILIITRVTSIIVGVPAQFLFNFFVSQIL